MRYLLAAVVTVLVAGVCQADMPGAIPVLSGMSREEVEKILGTPICQSFIVVGLYLGGSAVYERVDWLGGRQTVRVTFDDHDRVEDIKTYYRPFAVRPPWLDALHDGFGPRLAH